MGNIIRYYLAILLLVPVPALAETAYVIDQIKVGLHQDNSLDSPILKLLATGAELELLEKNNPMSQVKDENGETGWIKTEFLQAEKPTRRLFEEVSNRNQQLKNEIGKLQGQIQQANNKQQLKTLTAENDKLKQDIKSARLKAGELQAELTKLHKVIPTGSETSSDNQELYTRIAGLEQEKIRLEGEIQQLMDPAGDKPMNKSRISLKSISAYFKRHMVYVLGSLMVGFLGGLFIYDFINRRRHSGFRV